MPRRWSDGKLKRSYCLGLGESQLRSISDEERLRLNNAKISRSKAKDFLKFLEDCGSIRKPIKVVFSKEIIRDKRGKALWGLAFQCFREIWMFRWSVWVFLHEIAHIVSTPNRKHDYEFNKRLRKVYRLWLEFESV